MGEDDAIFTGLMGVPKYAEQFANLVNDMAFCHFTPENVDRVIDHINELGLQELLMSYHLRAAYNNARRIAEAEDIHPDIQEIFDRYIGYELDISRLFEFRDVTIDFIARRPYYIINEMRYVFGFTDMFYIVSVDGLGQISSVNGNKGRYFIENRVPVTPRLGPGQVFSHWVVNGQVSYDYRLLVSADYANEEGVVYVEMVYNYAPPPPFAISSAFFRNDTPGITIYNQSDVVQSTHGLFLSNDSHYLAKWPLPPLNLRPGSSWGFACRSSQSSEALFRTRLSFDIAPGDAIFLSDEDGVILYYVIPVALDE